MVMLQLPKTEHSLWRGSYSGTPYTPLKGEVEVDVAIIGAGITGLTAAYLLKQTGRTVAVLDKATVGGGTSGRTTGKVTSQHEIIYHDLYQRLGIDKAQAHAAINQTAVEQVGEIVNAEHIECGWRREDNYVFTDQDGKLETLQQEAEIAVELGLPASFVTETPLPFPVKGALKFSDQATFNSQAYLLGLAQAVHGGGSYVFEHSRVGRIHGKTPVTVGTGEGRVGARDIIVATNVPTLPLAARGEYCLFEYPQESYIVAAKVPGKLSGMYISPDPDHYSILPVTIDGAPGVLVGGEGRFSTLRGSKKNHYKKLAHYAETRFKASEITHRWSDRDYLSYDRLPLIGRLYPWSEHLYVGSAYAKWGLSGGTAAAMILTGIISGRASPYAAVFRPHRRQSVAAIPGAVKRYISS
jgi:glycine/D-amino acid oxidase-like deaminating enzyme